MQIFVFRNRLTCALSCPSFTSLCLQCTEFEKLADALLESNFSMLDKYCTLPSKRPPVSKTQATPGRPLSTTGQSCDSSVVCY